jgi:hypothetical protein
LPSTDDLSRDKVATAFPGGSRTFVERCRRAGRRRRSLRARRQLLIREWKRGSNILVRGKAAEPAVLELPSEGWQEVAVHREGNDESDVSGYRSPAAGDPLSIVSSAVLTGAIDIEGGRQIHLGARRLRDRGVEPSGNNDEFGAPNGDLSWDRRSAIGHKSGPADMSSG